MHVLDQARQWVSRGVGVIPIGHANKRPDFSALTKVGSVDHQGKAIWQTYQNRLPTDDELKSWFASGWAGLGIVAGWNGLVILDFDTFDVWETWKAWLEASVSQEARDLALSTYRVKSARGMHVYLYAPEVEHPYQVGAIDVKAFGGYVLAPPSRHPSGAYYVVDQDAPVRVCADLGEIFPFEPSVPVTSSSTISRHAMFDNPLAAARPSIPLDVDRIRFVKDHISILDLLPQAQGESPNRFGRITTLCPLHNDHSPSFWIDTQSQRCGCFAGCHEGKSLDVIDLWALQHRISLGEALGELYLEAQKRAGRA